VTVDFEGKIDGEPFDGGKAEGYAYVVGEGQMLREFEDAVRGMKVGESKTFPLAFPADYQGKEVAGKTADFLVTVHKVEAGHLPEVDETFIRSLGIAEGTQRVVDRGEAHPFARTGGQCIQAFRRHMTVHPVANQKLGQRKPLPSGTQPPRLQPLRAALRAGQMPSP
jgi:hypothetical protein